MRVFHEHFWDKSDLVIIVDFQHLLFYKFGSGNWLSAQTIKFDFAVKNFYLEHVKPFNTFKFYFVSLDDEFSTIDINYNESHVVWNQKSFDSLPIEIRSLKILTMDKLKSFFVFTILDQTRSHVLLCAIRLAKTIQFHAVVYYQPNRRDYNFFVFPSSDPDVFLISSFDENPFYQLILRERPTLDVSALGPVPFDLYVVAKNYFYTKEAVVVRRNQSSSFELLDFVSGFLEGVLESWVILLIFCSFLVLILHHLYFASRLSKVRPTGHLKKENVNFLENK